MDEVTFIYHAITNRLISTVGNWGKRIYSEVAPTNAPRPFVVVRAVTSTRQPIRRAMNVYLMQVDIIAYADSLADSTSAKSLISAALNNTGTHDNPASVLGASLTSHIVNTVTETARIRNTNLQDANLVYSDGATYEIVLEEITSA